MSRIAIIFTAVLGGIYTYVSFRDLNAGWEWALMAVPFVLVWLIPVLLWQLDGKLPWGIDTRLFQAGFGSAGFLSFVLVLTVIRDACVLLPARFLASPETFALWDGPAGDHALLAAAALLFLTGLVRALGPPAVKEVHVTIDGLSASFTELRIAQISDLHVGPTIGRRFVERVVERVNRLQPDLIAITGDLVDGELSELRSDVAPLAALRAQYGVFYVIGNHESYWGSPAWIDAMRKLGMRVLLNSGESFLHGGEKVWLGGVIDPAAGAADPAAAMGGADAGRACALPILLAHQPGAADAAEKAGFRLQLSGHTHAGQFFPWTWVVRRFHRHYSGLSRQGRLQIYVNPGTGSWGPPVRLGSTHEITHLRIGPARS